jgi:hypothetical protein
MINRLFFLGEYRGPNNRLNRNKYPHLYVRTVYVPGNCRWYAVVTFFENVAECIKYGAKLDDIVNVIDALNKQRSAGTITSVLYASKLEYDWMPMIDRFVEEWGKDMVPHDVRDSYDHVQEIYVELPRLHWPHNVDVPSDVVAEISLFTPLHNDELEIVDLATNANEGSTPA